MIMAKCIAHFVMMLFVAFLIQPSFCVKWIPSYAGPYKLVVKKIVNLTDEEAGSGQFWIHGYVSSFRQGHPQYIRGRQLNSIPLGNDLTVTMNVASRSNNQWIKNAFIMKFQRFCFDLTRHSTSTKILLFGDDGRTCPIPAGDRVINNRTIDLNFREFPSLPYGHWLSTVIVLNKKGHSVGGMAFEAETVPRV